MPAPAGDAGGTTRHCPGDADFATPLAALRKLRAQLDGSDAAIVVVRHRHDGSLVGCATLDRRDEPRFDRTGAGGQDRYGDWWVRDVFTHHRHRGRNVASSNVLALTGIARRRRLPAIHLYCDETLVAFYSSLGFEPAGVEALADGRCIVMRKSLAPAGARDIALSN
ncbi:MAG TPA: GNAT family N-acetyltransferase [Burkholderiaceae bacterium]